MKKRIILLLFIILSCSGCIPAYVAPILINPAADVCMMATEGSRRAKEKQKYSEKKEEREIDIEEIDLNL